MQKFTLNITNYCKNNYQSIFKGTLGWIILIVVWFIISKFEIINSHILPSPGKVVDSFFEMYHNYNLFGDRVFYENTKDTDYFSTLLSFFDSNFFFSVKINMAGFFFSVLFAIPVGFAIGLSKTLKELFSQQVNSLRFIPITALGGIFIALAGLTIWTKIDFLAFGIWVYLVPVIVQRLEEIETNQKQMLQTLGASKWQTFKYLQWKYVSSRLTDDVRILVGISWTYIIVAELKNIQGGLGSLIFLGERQGNSGFVYCSIIIIVIFGILSDRAFKYFDKRTHPFKYA